MNDKIPKIPSDDELMAGLEKLASGLDEMRYPGQAWPAVEKARPVAWMSKLAWFSAAAAAAIVILAVGYNRPASDPPAPQQAAREKAIYIEPAKESVEWVVPTGLDVAVGANFSMDIPTFTMPAANAGGFEFTIPTISFPTIQQRSTENDSQESSHDDGSGDVDGRLARSRSTIPRDQLPARTI